MKPAIEKLMGEKQIDALLVCGSGRNNPAMVYMTGGVDITTGDLIKVKGKEPVLFHSPIERDGAAEAGMATKSYAEFNLKDLLVEAGGDPGLAVALRYKMLFESLELTCGKVAVYGNVELGSYYYYLSKLSEFFPGMTFETSLDEDVIRLARITKDENELQRMKRMGEITADIVGNVADFLTSHGSKDMVVMKKDGTPLTISDVKKFIGYQLIEHHVQADEYIFAIGRDAAVPHNMGNPTSKIKLGETIIFDAFFQEKGGGYFHDFTRTWCLGFATDEVQQVYEHVKSVYNDITESLEAGYAYNKYHMRSNELFEELGYKTLNTDPKTTSGYVHSLGHGVGLQVHESPFCHTDIPEYILKPGMVITIEPGLYFPEKGYGARIEDCYYFDSQGIAKRFIDYPQELVLPM